MAKRTVSETEPALDRRVFVDLVLLVVIGVAACGGCVTPPIGKRRSSASRAPQAASQPKATYEACLEAARLFTDRGVRKDAAEVIAEAERNRADVVDLGRGRGGDIHPGGG